MPAFQLQKIDESLLQEHCDLSDIDHCYFFGEYAGRQGYNHSEMNSLIQNLKKPVKRMNHSSEWRYKEEAITKVVKLLNTTPLWPKLKTCLWIPIPPSKSKKDEQYDDRLMKILCKLQATEKTLDFRELLSISSSREEAHVTGNRRLTVQEHIDNFIFDDSKINPLPRTIIIFDDVITTGATFKAAQSILQKKYPKILIIGIFIARSIKQHHIHKNT